MRKEPYLVGLLAIAWLIHQQVSAGAQSGKVFEVASIRPHAPGTSPGGGASGQSWLRVAGTRVDLTGVSVRTIISRAFGIPRWQGDRIVGLPDWAIREAFDVRAIMPAGATEQDSVEMLKTLLAERFALESRVEQRPFPVYELTVGPSGPRFPEVQPLDEVQKDFTGDPGRSISDNISGLPGDELRSMTRREADGTRFITVTPTMRHSFKVVEGDARQLDAERITMQEFSRLIWQGVDRPVVDMTGLKGLYRFKTMLPPIRMSAWMQTTLGDRASAGPAGGPSLSRALEELGLKLEPSHTPVDFILIDRIERPTPN